MVNYNIPNSLFMKNDIMYHYFNSNTREILNPVDSIIIRNNKYNNFQVDLNNYLKNFPEIGNFNLIKLKTTYGNSKIGTKNTDIYIFIDADLTPYVKYSSKYFSLYNLFLDCCICYNTSTSRIRIDIPVEIKPIRDNKIITDQKNIKRNYIYKNIDFTR
jgi:hypothetical protein